jgi:hypothetical protein
VSSSQATSSHFKPRRRFETYIHNKFIAFLNTHSTTMPRPKKLSNPCIFSTFTNEYPEGCSKTTQRLTDKAWEKLTDEYKLTHPWMQKGHWLCSRHFTRATVSLPRSRERAARPLERKKRPAPDSDTDDPLGSVSLSPKKVSSARHFAPTNQINFSLSLASTSSESYARHTQENVPLREDIEESIPPQQHDHFGAES